ncbi:uncharacterized protein OCT59_007960 [Rhizophagus irregularis]|uniref:uncharacterized protein n=1 Tax=Rhizophagus irregularis TaxID=588596 RepID=UPI003327193F|nr:hypothetical protein OCT59_007960 [Rhizophagus irregularis]
MSKTPISKGHNSLYGFGQMWILRSGWDFSQSNPQRNFEGFTFELAIPEDGFPLDFYWMDVTDDGETFAIIRSIFSHERND